MIEDVTLTLSPEIASREELIKEQISKLKGYKQDEINDIYVLRRSIDARKKKIKVNITVRVAIGSDEFIPSPYRPVNYSKINEDAPSLIIVGAGPAGLFGALKALELGIRPIIIERGADVDKRRKIIADISKSETIDPDTNYCFGEGGAGAYSDGKLFTRSKKRGNISEILSTLHQFGAAENILIDSHPHIGSDKLPEIIKKIRQKIVECGGEVHFNEKVTQLIFNDKKVIGVKTNLGNSYNGEGVMLAIGHSARDFYRYLYDNNVSLEAKGIAMGVRLEHPQALIDCLQYHSKNGRGQYLPPAEYSFVSQIEGRGVYSFCMCPGGVVVPSMSSPGESVVNGMSASARSGKWANAAMLVEIRPEDISPDYLQDPLVIMDYQEEIEKKFYKTSDNSYKAPAQRMVDFINEKDSETLPASSYPLGLVNARIDKDLPDFISDRLKKGFLEFDKKCKGFISKEAVVLGLESRSSSPVRIPRNSETFEHIEIENLYPAGEGAGYAGGIVSSAMDGIKCVEKFSDKLNRMKELSGK